jgi:hypothetical protein
MIVLIFYEASKTQTVVTIGWTILVTIGFGDWKFIEGNLNDYMVALIHVLHIIYPLQSRHMDFFLIEPFSAS